MIWRTQERTGTGGGAEIFLAEIAEDVVCSRAFCFSENMNLPFSH